MARMIDAFICDAVRTPIGRYGGVLAGVRADDLAAVPIAALLRRNPQLEPAAVEEVLLGCANQAGEDNRNVARMALLLAGLPVSVAGATINRLCGSGLDALASAARLIRCGEAQVVIAGGVESMSRAPVRHAQGGRRLRPQRDHLRYHPRLALRESPAGEAVRRRLDARDRRERRRAVPGEPRRPGPVRAAQPGAHRGRLCAQFLRQRAHRGGDPAAQGAGACRSTATSIRVPTTLAQLAALPTPFRAQGTVTAGNASGLNDGACALLVASGDAAQRLKLTPRARIVAAATAGVEPRIMGMGPVPAVRKVLAIAGLALGAMQVIELNEAFAAQALAVMRELGLPDDAAHVNPNGGAIALGHPLGMSGARLATTATWQLAAVKGRYALCTMCIGVGQGIALVLERV